MTEYLYICVKLNDWYIEKSNYFIASVQPEHTGAQLVRVRSVLLAKFESGDRKRELLVEFVDTAKQIIKGCGELRSLQTRHHTPAEKKEQEIVANFLSDLITLIASADTKEPDALPSDVQHLANADNALDVAGMIMRVGAIKVADEIDSYLSNILEPLNNEKDAGAGGGGKKDSDNFPDWLQGTNKITKPILQYLILSHGLSYSSKDNKKGLISKLPHTINSKTAIAEWLRHSQVTPNNVEERLASLRLIKVSRARIATKRKRGVASRGDAAKRRRKSSREEDDDADDANDDDDG